MLLAFYWIHLQKQSNMKTLQSRTNWKQTKNQKHANKQKQQQQKAA